MTCRLSARFLTMTRHVFGEPVSEDDVLVVQGIEYPMMPIGMRAMRRLLTMRQQLSANRKEDDPVTEAEIDLALDIVVNSVRPECRDKFRDHIEDSVPPDLLVRIASAVMESFSDLDPTRPESSSGGSSQTGPDSTAGVSAGELIPTA
jgi:hypothetical protein